MHVVKVGAQMHWLRPVLAAEGSTRPQTSVPSIAKIIVSIPIGSWTSTPTARSATNAVLAARSFAMCSGRNPNKRSLPIWPLIISRGAAFRHLDEQPVGELHLHGLRHCSPIWATANRVGYVNLDGKVDGYVYLDHRWLGARARFRPEDGGRQPTGTRPLAERRRRLAFPDNDTAFAYGLAGPELANPFDSNARRETDPPTRSTTTAGGRPAAGDQQRSAVRAAKSAFAGRRQFFISASRASRP